MGRICGLGRVAARKATKVCWWQTTRPTGISDMRFLRLAHNAAGQGDGFCRHINGAGAGRLGGGSDTKAATAAPGRADRGEPSAAVRAHHGPGVGIVGKVSG